MNLYEAHGITLTPDQKKQFEKLSDLFLEWNNKMNLSSIRDPEGVLNKHFIDSLLSTKHIDFSDKNILDLGAGGGFPCLPLSIMTPSSTFSALDSVGKKMKAVQDMADQLNVKLKTFHGRIEEFGQEKNFREKFDIVTARALAPWSILLEYALPFVKVGGIFVAYQGPAIKEELHKYKNIEKIFGGEIGEIIEDSLESSGDRIFVIIKKIKPCSQKFPREVGVPKKNPLIAL